MSAVASGTDEWSLEDWRQGDIILDAAVPFMHLADAENPLSAEAKRVAEQPGEPNEWPLLIEVDVPGLVILTQSCDLVRPSSARPYVEVAPLQTLTPELMQEVRRNTRPQYAALPGLGARDLAVDLDRVMTLEKAVIAKLGDRSRVRGCPDAAATAEFAGKLARKRSRPAFPTDFVEAIRPIQERIKKKHGNDSPEGRFYAACDEIRVVALPDWSAPTSVGLWFLFEREASVPADGHQIVTRLASRFHPTGPVVSLDASVAGLDGVTAKFYKESVPLDLDYLSTSGP
ncbi:MAG: hypothetical protein ACHP84_01755 [Caulobacterales bacterium]